MAEKTGIAWTDHTFNPWWGCVKVSPGCQHCYAETFSTRYGHDVWGPAKTTPRRTFGVKHWTEPLHWNRDAARVQARRRVFSGSMCDVFEDHPTANAVRGDLWALVRNASPTTCGGASSLTLRRWQPRPHDDRQSSDACNATSRRSQVTATKAIDADVTAIVDRWGSVQKDGGPEHQAASEALDALLVDYCAMRAASRRAVEVPEAESLLALVRLAAMDGYNPKPLSPVDVWVEEAKKWVLLVYLAGRNASGGRRWIPNGSEEHPDGRLMADGTRSRATPTLRAPEVTEPRRVVSVMADGLIVVHDDASDEEINRAFLRITQFLAGDLEGLRQSATTPVTRSALQSQGRHPTGRRDMSESERKNG